MKQNQHVQTMHKLLFGDKTINEHMTRQKENYVQHKQKIQSNL